MEARYGIWKVNENFRMKTTKFAKISAIKKTAEYEAVTCRC